MSDADIKAYYQHTALAIARDDLYRKYVLQPRARLKAAPVAVALNEHLSAEPAYAATAEAGKLSMKIRQAVEAAFEEAMLLAAELDACGDYFQPTWFESGHEFDARKMEPSVHTASEDPTERRIAITSLPGVDIRLSHHRWNVSCPAFVHKSAQKLVK
jgi:hypothetical protein